MNNIPNCPICLSQMVKRKSNSSSFEFWGCQNFPECKGKRYIDSLESFSFDNDNIPFDYIGENELIDFQRDWERHNEKDWWDKEKI